jgi:hypothetical protein
MPKQVVIVVSPEGQVRHLVGDLPPEFLDLLGPVEHIYRNSHVESTQDLWPPALAWICAHRRDLLVNLKEEAVWKQLPQNVWWADMTPVAGPVLGPFDEYPQALAAEVLWLQEHHLPPRQ